VKIPLQALILLTGVLVFTFYLFQTPPMLFNPVHEAEMQASSRAAEWTALDTEFQNVLDVRRAAVRDAVTARRTGNPAATSVAQAAFVEHQQNLTTIRGRAVSLVKEVTHDDSYNDVNYVFPTFVTTELPIGLVGLIVAAIFAAAMSSIAAELNSLSTSTVIDMYRRHIRTDASDQHYLRVSKIVTGFWGLFASIVAVYAANLGSLIEVVNRFGSFFYGSLLGVFILAVGTRRATSPGAVWGLVGGMVTVTYVAVTSSISFLWLNVVGATAVVVVGMAISTLFPAHERPVA